jgi:hypothetical protein
MKVFISAITIAVMLVGCGPSGPSGPTAEEKQRIASRACSEILETRKFESSKRAQIWNDAVDKIGMSGSYWSSFSDSNVQLIVLGKGVYGAGIECKKSLLDGSSPF